MIDGQLRLFEILDTAAQEGFPMVRSLHFSSFLTLFLARLPSAHLIDRADGNMEEVCEATDSFLRGIRSVVPDAVCQAQRVLHHRL